MSLRNGEEKLKIPHWFNVENYASAANWTAKEWSNAIFDRLLIRDLVNSPDTEAKEILPVFLNLFGAPTENPEIDVTQGWNAIVKAIHLNPKGVDKSHFRYYKNKLKPVEPATLSALGYWIDHATQDLTEDAKDYIFGRNFYPVSKEVKEIGSKTLEDRRIEMGLKPEDWSNLAYARINLAMPKNLLLKRIEEFIDESREKYGINYMPKTPSKSDFENWYEARILGYFDLQLLTQINSMTLTQQQIGKHLFPEEFDVQLADRVRKVTMRHAAFVFQEWVCTALDHAEEQE